MEDLVNDPAGSIDELPIDVGQDESVEDIEIGGGGFE